VPQAGATWPDRREKAAAAVARLHRIAARCPIGGAFQAPPRPRNGRSSPAAEPSSAAAIRARAARSDGRTCSSRARRHRCARAARPRPRREAQLEQVRRAEVTQLVQRHRRSPEGGAHRSPRPLNDVAHMWSARHGREGEVDAGQARDRLDRLRRVDDVRARAVLRQRDRMCCRQGARPRAPSPAGRNARWLSLASSHPRQARASHEVSERITTRAPRPHETEALSFPRACPCSAACARTTRAPPRSKLCGHRRPGRPLRS
jgi:hypothetical protein